MGSLAQSAADENSLKAFATLGEFLQVDGWHPQIVADKAIYRMSFSGRHAQFICYAQILMGKQQFLFYALAPVKVPAELCPEVAEFIARANFEIVIGNFELDFSDGEVRYKSSLDFEGAALTAELIEHAIYPAVNTMDRYLPGLMSMIYANIPAQDAIQQVEQE
jgi:hypothetical protein